MNILKLNLGIQQFHNTGHLIPAVLLLCSLLTFSCAKQEDKNYNPDDNGRVKVRISRASFDDEINFKSGSTLFTDYPLSNRQTVSVDFNADYYLTATLTPEPSQQADKNPSTKADIIIDLLENDVKYKIVVFDPNGGYVTEKNYSHQNEDTEGDLLLDEYKEYTFIAYSINSSSTAPPDMTFTNPNVKTLATARVSVPGNADFMYFKKKLTLVANTTNYLEVAFKHLFSEITTKIDVSATGYTLNAFEATISPHKNSANISLASAAITRPVANVTAPVLFTPNPTNSVTTLINSPENTNTTLTVSKITVGEITETNLPAITNLKITPGVRYNLTLKITPNDKYLVHQGIPAAQIGGQIWALHNVGVAINQDPNQSPITSQLHGNYYQFGRLSAVAGPTSITENSNWNATEAPYTAWNTGTELAPVKTATDPCPAGFRVPTRMQMAQLVANVTPTNRGSFAESNTHYNAAKVLTSKRNKNIWLVLPAQGLMNTNTANAPIGIDNRGNTVNYYTSSASSAGVWRLIGSETTFGLTLLTDGDLLQGRTLRCIAE
ncbi:hypothetical protein ACL9RF_04290 [Sphingobacterium sp. Mn56C]|uniref:hypothetical protein n=1 Tax=Sphingobacterium sp. Mn56C TaxID=3395261 RepID=UPI003BDA5915